MTLKFVKGITYTVGHLGEAETVEVKREKQKKRVYTVPP